MNVGWKILKFKIRIKYIKFVIIQNVGKKNVWNMFNEMRCWCQFGKHGKMAAPKAFVMGQLKITSPPPKGAAPRFTICPQRRNLKTFKSKLLADQKSIQNITWIKNHSHQNHPKHSQTIADVEVKFDENAMRSYFYFEVPIWCPHVAMNQSCCIRSAPVSIIFKSTEGHP